MGNNCVASRSRPPTGGPGSKIEFRTRPLLDLDRIAERDDPISLLVRELRRLATDEAALRAVADEALKRAAAEVAGGTPRGP